MSYQNIIEETLINSIKLKEQVLKDSSFIRTINLIADVMIKCYQKEHKILFCGNGGSAADAQHLAAELSGRYYFDRPPLFAEALHVNTSYVTAVANDYSYDEIYARLIKAMGSTGDILIGLSTSGNSANVINAFKQAKEKGITSIALTGKSGGKLRELADIIVKVPSDDTPRIQELHMIIGHTLCQIVEQKLFTNKV